MAFAIIDGDDVGSKVESRILENDVIGFVRTSQMIAASVESLAGHASAVCGVTVISSGGDSILLQVADESVAELREVLEVLQNPRSFTFSVGIGETLRESFIALRMAKSSGKRKVALYSEDLR